MGRFINDRKNIVNDATDVVKLDGCQAALNGEYPDFGHICDML
jgi:hypothetical protein